MRLVLSRAAAGRTLLVAAAVAAVVTTVLLTGFVLYAQLLPVAGVRAAVLDAPAADRSLLVNGSAGQAPEDLADRDAAVRDLLGGELAGVPLTVRAGGYASGQELPAGLVPEDGAFAVVAFLEDLATHAELVDGDWPAPVAPDAPAQAALPAVVADELGLRVGDLLAIVDAGGAGPVPAPLVVVGLWEPLDAADPYWQLAAGPLERGGLGPFVVSADEFTARYQRVAIVEWVGEPDPARLAEASVSGIGEHVEALERALVERRESDPAMGSVRMRTGLAELAERLDVAMVVNRSGMVLPAGLLVVIAGYGLVLVARLLAAHRQGENALLRARGASRRQLVRLSVAEAVLVVAPAAVLGGPVGAQLVRFADQRVAQRSLGVSGDLAGYGLVGPPLGWLVAVAAAAGCAVALAVPAVRLGRTWAAEQQERSRPGRVAVLQRAGVDAALVGLAVLAWTQLRRYGTAVSAGDTGLGVDPLVVAAPVVGVLAGAAVALRFLPPVTRLGVRLAGRRDGFAGLLGMWQADRRPHAGPVLLLVLAVGTAVLAPAVASTWQQSQRDQAAHQVGADLRVSVANPSAASGAELLGVLPEGAAGMPVYRDTVGLPGGEQTTLMALVAERAKQVVLVRPDLAAGGAGRLFGALPQGRPAIDGVALPEGTRRLVGRFRFDSPGSVRHTFTFIENIHDPDSETPTVEQQVPGPLVDQLSAHVVGADGVVRSVQLGLTEAGAVGDHGPIPGIDLDEHGGLDIDVALPPDADMLVGLGAGVSAFGWQRGAPPGQMVPDPGGDPVPVSWHWEDLRAVDAEGVEVPLELPGTWGVHMPRALESAPVPERVASQPAVGVSLRPERDFPISLRYLLTAPVPELSALPVVVSPDVLEATGSQVGSTLNLDTDGAGPNALPALRAVGTVEAVPGTADGSGVMVDLAWLSTHQLLQLRRTPAPTEWWVSTPGAGPGPAGAAAGLEAGPGSAAGPSALGELTWVGSVVDRQVEARRLLEDPLGSGVLFCLWAAAAAAGLLAAFGLVVDSRATAVRRRRELAVLHTLGAPPRALARALVVEQAVLAGLGVAAGVLVGVAVAGAMGVSLVLTPAGEVPVPVPLLTLSPVQFSVPTLGLFVVAVVLGAVVARRVRREVAAGALRIGED
jgi:hypothetical protein